MYQHIDPDLAPALRQAAQRRGLTNRELARELGCHESYVSLLMSGQRDPSVRTLRQLAEVLGLDLNRTWKIRTRAA